KIERMRPRKEGKEGENDLPPDWLDVVERQEEEKAHCKKCGEVIPSYAEGVCPRCLHKRKILWRLLDVAKPYRTRVRLALGLTMLASMIAAFPAFIQKFLIDRAIVPVRWDATLGQMVHVDLPMATRVHQLFLWAGLLTAVIVISELCAGWRLRVLAMLGTQ